MLDSLKQDIDNLTAFDWKEELDNIIDTNKDAILTLQTEQMASGVDGNKEPTTLDGNGYTPYTKDMKEKYGEGLGAVTDMVTGYMTGELYSTMEVVTDENTFTMESPVEYFPALLERTGVEWARMNDDYAQQFADNVTLPAIQIIFKEKTGFEIESE